MNPDRPSVITRSGVASSAILGAVLVFLFGLAPYATGYGDERHSIAYWLWYFWRFPEWQHGALVPFVVAALVWWKRRRLLELPLEGSNLAFPAVLLALFLWYAGHRSNTYYLGYASCHLLLAGMVLWIAGRRWFRQLFFPLCFIAFMWPLYFLESRIGFPLRMLMTEVSSGILSGAGIEHLKLGSAIVSAPDPSTGLEQGGRFALEVANPCSGIRSLFALMMVGALYGYLGFRGSWRWFVLSASAIPLAIAGNVVRILLLTAGSICFGSDFAVGSGGSTSPFHFAAGIAVFLTAVGGMLLTGRILNRMEGARRPEPDPAPASPLPDPGLS